MKAEMLLDAIGLLDERHFEVKGGRALPWRRPLAALTAAVLMVMLSIGTALAVSPELRELVFRFLHVEQEQRIPTGTVDTELPVEDMFVEPGIPIGDALCGTYVHTPVATLAREGVFLVCTDDVHTKQGSHYDAYCEQQGQLVRLEEHLFARDYALGDTTFSLQFHWAEHNGKTVITWMDENASFRIPGNAGAPSSLLVQLVFTSTDQQEEYMESYYPVLLDLTTGELTDVLSGTGAEKLEQIVNSAISEDLTKMLLCGVAEEGYALYYADLTSGRMHSLDELSGERVDSCSLIGNTLACWSLTEGYYKGWSIDLTTLQRTELFASVFNAAVTPEADAGIVFLMGFDNWVHEGDLYAGSAFALEVDEAQNVFVIDLATGQKVPIEGYTWTTDTQRIPSPDGTKLLLAQCPDWQDYEYVGVLDFENGTFTEFSRENRKNESLAYWFSADTVVICGALSPESLCSDYYLYRLTFGGEQP